MKYPSEWDAVLKDAGNGIEGRRPPSLGVDFGFLD
jgi:hypothetical protein